MVECSTRTGVPGAGRIFCARENFSRITLILRHIILPVRSGSAASAPLGLSVGWLIDHSGKIRSDDELAKIWPEP
jgi:hypothetical protein